MHLEYALHAIDGTSSQDKVSGTEVYDQSSLLKNLQEAHPSKGVAPPIQRATGHW